MNRSLQWRTVSSVVSFARAARQSEIVIPREYARICSVHTLLLYNTPRPFGVSSGSAASGAVFPAVHAGNAVSATLWYKGFKRII
jgi:hypothetical protein